ncbi:hypothetical protein NBRC10512_004138 [Rhodotorula toruloides]|uniref:RHTO0S27e01794g1_1 n=2 Tax=Rhodotorula toruloides TaxID=5286 RepID=A0A061BHU2_RHOTO|nr:uncharacterized protein RHTO_08007 [Rhodotorula toruloides NP11]EMS22654.1 hypothetical protein RHTO_08007 [Rhodotorula toruloides NP11]CDR49538.1 RHTO0S27e01794g1_1 [Rhodotorula toruloides]
MPQPQRAPAETPPLSFLVPLLPLILSADPINLPRTLLAQSAQQAAHYLGLTAEDDEYWTLGRKDEEVSRLRREVVEAGSLDDLTPSAPLFSHDLEELRCLIPLSLPHSPSSSSSAALGVVLVWEGAVSPLSAAQGGAPQPADEEEEDDVRPGWTFLELQALPSPFTHSARQSWYPSLDEALAASTAGLVQALGIASSGGGVDVKGGKQSARGEEKEKLMASMAGYESNAASLRRAAAEEEDEEEGEERNGGAIASAEHFWAGWDEEEGEEQDGAKTPNGREAEGETEEDEEKGYWDSYSGVGSQVGEEDNDPRLERLGEDDSTPPTPLAPHNPQPSFHFTRDSASSLPSSSSSTSDPAADARPLYFSTTLPPLPDSHFGISPTQPNPEISRFSATDTAASVRSGGSHYDFLIELSEDGEEEEEFTPRRLDVGPARSASLAQVVLPPLSTAQSQSQSRPSPTRSRPKVHARTPSDILKALPSVPAFPVVSRPRPASNAIANGIGVATTQVLEGSVYVNAPGGGGGGGTSPPRGTFPVQTAQRSPTSPARTPTSASYPSTSASSPTSAPRSPAKALPPAPAPRTPTRTVSHSHSFASPSSSLSKRPHTQRSQSSSGVPRTPKAVSNGAAGGAGEGLRSPVRNGGFWAPPAASNSSASSSPSSSGSSANTIAIAPPPPQTLSSAPVQRQGSQTTPLPSLAVFPSSSIAPSFALPSPPERHRRSVDSTATGLTGMLEELVRGTMGDPQGVLEEREEGEWGEKEVEREEERVGEEEEEEEALKAALSGLWRMYSRAGQRRDVAGLDKRRIRFETVVREVIGE